MSVKALAWAWAQDIPTATKVVLMALADHADDDGICWPGVKGVAEKCGISRRNTRRHISKLISLRLVESMIRVRSDGSQTSNIYVLRMGSGEVNFDTEEGSILTPPPVTGDRGGMSLVTGGDVTGDIPRTVIEPSLEPSGDMHMSTENRPAFLTELRRIPAWSKVTEEREGKLLQWLSEQGITPRQALRAATALLGKWDGRKYKDPLATFKNWALREADRSSSPRRDDGYEEPRFGGSRRPR